MELFEYFRSSTSYRTRIALNLKGLAYNSIPVHLTRDGGEQKTPDYREKNPQALVPTLQNGGFRLSQSLAIIEWLEDTYPERKLLPGDPNDRAKVRAFAYAIACDIHPLQNLRVLQYLAAEFDADQDVKDAWCQRWIGDGLAACEAHVVREDRGGDFCFGAEPGLADICLVPQVFSAYRFKVDVSAMPNLVRIYEACNALPAFANAAPSKQPDAQ
ncbi:MAG: maleylacetoacetate isomerase [Pseudomonadota bacterium]